MDCVRRSWVLWRPQQTRAIGGQRSCPGTTHQNTARVDGHNQYSRKLQRKRPPASQTHHRTIRTLPHATFQTCTAKSPSVVSRTFGWAASIAVGALGRDHTNFWRNRRHHCMDSRSGRNLSNTSSQSSTISQRDLALCEAARRGVLAFGVPDVSVAKRPELPWPTPLRVDIARMSNDGVDREVASLAEAGPAPPPRSPAPPGEAGPDQLASPVPPLPASVAPPSCWLPVPLREVAEAEGESRRLLGNGSEDLDGCARRSVEPAGVPPEPAAGGAA